MATGTSLSNYLENALLNHVLKNTAFSQPTDLYVALYTTAPSDAGGGTEVSGGGYSRKTVTFSAASGGQASNSADVDFGTATADWGTVEAVAILDASSGGNFLFLGMLNQAKPVGNGDGCKFLATKLICALD